MQSVVRAASLGQLSRVTSSTVPNLAASVAEPVPMGAAPGIVQDVPALPLTSYSMSKQLVKGNQMRITSGLGGNYAIYCIIWSKLNYGYCYPYPFIS